MPTTQGKVRLYPWASQRVFNTRHVSYFQTSSQWFLYVGWKAAVRSTDRQIEDQRLLVLIKKYYIASGGTYSIPWIHRDLREAGETCSAHRVAKIMRQNNLKAQIGYKRRYIKGGKQRKLLTIFWNVILILINLMIDRWVILLTWKYMKVFYI